MYTLLRTNTTYMCTCSYILDKHLVCFKVRAQFTLYLNNFFARTWHSQWHNILAACLFFTWEKYVDSVVTSAARIFVLNWHRATIYLFFSMSFGLNGFVFLDSVEFQIDLSFKKWETSNIPSKSLLGMRGMDGCVSSKKRSARKIESMYLVVLLSILMQHVAERKYCMGVFGQLHGHAATQLRGNVGNECV